MKAVILAGGLGTRLMPFTQVIPKPLLPVGESSVLEIQLLSLKRHGVDDVFIAILAGIYVLRPALFEAIPYHEPYGIDRLICDLLESGKKVGKYQMHEYWLDIGHRGTYEEAQEAYREHFRVLR